MQLLSTGFKRGSAVGHTQCQLPEPTLIKLPCCYDNMTTVNTLRPRQNDDILKWISLNENARISLRISLKFVPKVRVNNIPALVQIMAWRRPGDKPLSEPMMVSLLTHVCVTRLQWVKRCPVIYARCVLFCLCYKHRPIRADPTTFSFSTYMKMW